MGKSVVGGYRRSSSASNDCSLQFQELKAFRPKLDAVDRNVPGRMAVRDRPGIKALMAKRVTTIVVPNSKRFARRTKVSEEGLEFLDEFP